MRSFSNIKKKKINKKSICYLTPKFLHVRSDISFLKKSELLIKEKEEERES